MVEKLQVKIFENTTAVTLELAIEKFLRENSKIEVTNAAYSVQKEKETDPRGHYSCLILYR